MKCQLCNRSVRNSFRARWRHLVNIHPERVARVLQPLMNPERAQSLGAALASAVRDRFMGRPQ